MLTYLDIRNYKIIENLAIDFDSHLTVITGETGAGKSIIIDTLELILGGRADGNVIFKNAQRCEITAAFDITNKPEIAQWLQGKDCLNTQECIVKRIFNADGRSKISINDSPYSLQTVRELGGLLLNIHGQHEQQNLLKPDKQREILDRFADTAELLANIKQIYTRWIKTKQALDALHKLNDNGITKIEFLRYQLEELENLALQESELENLHREHSILCNADELIAVFNHVINVAAEDEQSAIIHNLGSILRQLEKIQAKDPKIQVAFDLFRNATIQIEEAVNELRSYANAIELNKDRLDFIEKRLNKIYEIARKHKVKPEELIDLHSDLKLQLQKLETADIEAEKLQGEIVEIEKFYPKVANQLSERRKIAAIKLNKLISKEMQNLGMDDGEFVIELTDNQNQAPNPHGKERIDFLVTTNRGQAPGPLNKIVSGGELSRISLAIQVIIAEKNVTPILIFDEVDVGIGGKVAEIVGQMLRKIAHDAQVLCVTHLPQVAAQGHHHFKVEKQTKGDSTIASISKLDKKSRITEIARMLGGVKISSQALNHAEEMLR